MRDQRCRLIRNGHWSAADCYYYYYKIYLFFVEMKSATETVMQAMPYRERHSYAGLGRTQDHDT